MKMPVLLPALIVLTITSASAQSITSSVINTSGNSYTEGYYSLDWSVGEMAIIESMNAANGSNVITNGFLQPNGLAAITGRNFDADEIKILPNPTYDNFEINLLTTQQGNINIQVFDGNGKNIFTRRTVSYGVGSIERFSLTRFAAGAYYIKIELYPVLGSVRKTGTYKIVKL